MAFTYLAKAPCIMDALDLESFFIIYVIQKQIFNTNIEFYIKLLILQIIL